MEKYTKHFVTLIALLIFFLGGVLSILSKDKEFSEEENRYLSSAPTLGVKELFDGVYQTQMDNYLSDQMIFRTTLMGLYSDYQSLLLKTDYNGVYICKDKTYIEKYVMPENTEKIAKRFSDYATKAQGLNCVLMLVPTAIDIDSDKLPDYAQRSEERAVYDYIYSHSGMINIPVYEALSDAKENYSLYYRNDHHWTTDAAYIAYKSYCETLGISPVSVSNFTIETVSDSFLGTIYSKTLASTAKPDEIRVYKQDMSGITVNYPSGEGPLYNEEYLDKKDKYSYFLNGINPVIEISNDNIKNGRCLLVVKDSYANCFVPFLVNHYEKIVVLDTRYYRNGASAAAELYGATDCLFLFNLNTLDNEAALNGIY